MTVRYLGGIVELSEIRGKKGFRVQLLRAGEWDHPGAPNGKLNLTKGVLAELCQNFKAQVRGKEVPVDENHEDKQKRRAKAWINDVELSPDGESLYGRGYFTDDELAEAVRTEKVKYFSPELLFGVKAGNKVSNVIRAGSFTNFPFIKNMDPAQVVNLAEVVGADAELRVFLNDERVGDVDDDTGTGDRLADAQDPDAQDDDLPIQCTTCKLLFTGDCPFQGVDVKVAAAGEGACPQYVGKDSFSNDDDPATRKDNEVEMTEAEIKTLVEQRIVELSEEYTTKLGEKDAIIASLQSQVVNLAETRQAHQDEAFVTKFISKGNLTPAQGNIVKNILLAERSEKGTVELSENGNTVEKDVPTLLSELIESIEPQVDLGDESVHRSRRRSNPDEDPLQVDLDEIAVEEARKLATERGGNWQGYYGEALRAVTARKRARG